jgi:hypothetical protein
MLQLHMSFYPIFLKILLLLDKGYVSNKLDNFLTNLDIKLSSIFRKKRKIRKGVETAFSVMSL